MPLRCPRCRSLVEVPNQLNRFFNMPVACHICRRIFAAPPQSPLHDSAVPQRLVGPLDRSISAERCSHERACPSCRRPVRLPGLDRSIGPLDLSCPYSRARFRLEASGGISPRVIAAALGLGLVFGLAVLWLDHQGIIALRQLRLTQTVLDWARDMRHWLPGWG